eukprot:s2440_g14.t1
MQEPVEEELQDRLPTSDTLEKLNRAPTLRLGETGEELPEDEVAKDMEAEAECEAHAVQEAAERFDKEMAKQAEEVASGKPTPGQEAMLPTPPPPAPAREAVSEAVAIPGEMMGPVTSTTHRKQFMALQRVVQGPRAGAFPEITRLFGSGTKAERLNVLRSYVQNGEHLQAVESAFRASRTHSETLRTTRRLMTIREMQQAGKKLLDVLLEVGLPTVMLRTASKAQSTGQTLSLKRQLRMTTPCLWKLRAAFVQVMHAMGALTVPGNHVGTSVSVADPLAMVRQQMAAAASSAAPATPLSEAAPASSNSRPKAKAKAKAVSQPRGPPLSDIALAGKTVDEKVADSRMTRAELGAVLKEFKKPSCLVKCLVQMGHREILGMATSEYWEILSREFGVHRPDDVSDCIPVSLFGDEVEVFDGNQYMCINWSSEVSIHHTNAKLSKFLCVMIPTSAYFFNGKVNVTLQQCLSILVHSLNTLYTSGVAGVKLAVASVKGDWKFMCQALNAKNGPSSNHICFRCGATKDLTAPMTDLSRDAVWRQSQLEEEDIWHSAPALTELQCFSTKLMCPDILHTYHLGIGRDVKARMQRATAEVKAWCKAHSTLQLPRRWHLSKTKLSLKSGKYVHYIGKGFHVSILLGFLHAFVASKNVDSELKMLVWSGDTLMSFLHNRRKDGLLLAERDVRQVLVLGEYHLKQLLAVNRKFNGWPTYRLFNIRPKFHSMSHILEFAQSRRNPVTQACWMEEDWIRSVANLAKKTHSRTTPLSTLQRYTAGQ